VRLALAAALAALLAVPAPHAAAGKPAGGEKPAAGNKAGADVVSLRFAWPESGESKVTYTKVKKQTGKPEQKSVFRYTGRAEKKGAEWRLTTSDTTWEGVAPFPPALAEEGMRASEKVVQVVSADLSQVRLEGTEALDPIFAKMFANSSIPEAQRQRVMEMVRSAMLAEANEMWNLAVGFWEGADLPLGKLHSAESEGELPMAPGAAVKFQMRFQARKRVACAGERQPRCVELSLTSVPDPKALKPVLEKFMASLVPAGQAPPAGLFEKVSIQNELSLVTEPGTLRPHRLTWIKKAHIRSLRKESETLERAEYRYHYPAAL
jgi:hypothetical protein